MENREKGASGKYTEEFSVRRYDSAAASFCQKKKCLNCTYTIWCQHWNGVHCSHMLESVIDTRFSTSKYWVVDSTQEYGLCAATGGTAGVPCLQFSRQPPSVWNTPSQCGETEDVETETENRKWRNRNRKWRNRKCRQKSTPGPASSLAHGTVVNMVQPPPVCTVLRSRND